MNPSSKTMQESDDEGIEIEEDETTKKEQNH